MIDLEVEIARMVAHYTKIRNHIPHSSLLMEVRWQYADMAMGGDGEPDAADGSEKLSLREEYYDGFPDSFFQRVCDLMQWFPKGMPSKERE